MIKFKIGDSVIAREDVKGYYSNYAGRPEIIWRKGFKGIVGAVKVPSVRRENVFFNCVDFYCENTKRTERCCALDKQIKKVMPLD